MTNLAKHTRSTLALVVALAIIAMTATTAVSRGATPQTDTLTQRFARIEHKPLYRQSTWGYDVLDQRTRQVLASQNDQQMFDPGSR